METTMEKVNTMEFTKHTNRELADLMQGLMAVKDLKGVRFSLQVTKNINLIKSELEHIEEAAKPSEEFLEIAKLVQVIEGSGKTDEEKKEEVAKLEEKNADLVADRKKQIDEFNNMLEDEIEVSLFKISEKHLPEDITAQQLMGINQLIKE
jgi:ribosomal protein L11